jgi:hypothetical protein
MSTASTLSPPEQRSPLKKRRRNPAVGLKDTSLSRLVRGTTEQERIERSN